MDRGATTRRRLQEHALRLFTERGFDDVTVDEIAAAAGVSHMTFFRHFPTKESVVFDDRYDPLIAAAVAEQDSKLPAIERIRRGVLASLDVLDPADDEDVRARLRIASGTRSLRARIWENNLRTEEATVDALTGSGTDELEALVAAGAILGALTAALLHWAETGNPSTLSEQLRLALGHLEPSTGPRGATR